MQDDQWQWRRVEKLAKGRKGKEDSVAPSGRVRSVQGAIKGSGSNHKLFGEFGLELLLHARLIL